MKVGGGKGECYPPAMMAWSFGDSLEFPSKYDREKIETNRNAREMDLGDSESTSWSSAKL
jgi:hypothetical protein